MLVLRRDETVSLIYEADNVSSVILIDDIIVVDKCLQCYSNGELVDSVCLNNFVDEAQFEELIQNIVTKNEIREFLSDEGYIKNLDFDFTTGELIFEK